MFWSKRLLAVGAAAALLGLQSFARANDEGNLDSSIYAATSSFTGLYLQPNYGYLKPAADQLAPGLSLQPAALTDAIWVGMGETPVWTNPLNWNTNLIPDDAAAIARFTGISGGPIVDLGGGTVTLLTLSFNDPIYSGITGGTINLIGSVLADGANFDLPEKVFATFGAPGIRGGNNIGGAGSLAATFAGSNGLTKLGDTHLQIDSDQYFTGTTSVLDGGKIISTIGDGAFGNLSNSIALDNGSIQIATTNWTTARTVTVGDDGGSIYWVGTGRAIDFSGNFAGNGTLILNGKYGVSVGSLLVHTASTLTGTLNIGGGTVGLVDDGAFTSVPAIRSSGSTTLDNSNSVTNVDRIGDTASMTLRGAALTLKGGSTAYSETIGELNLDGGVSIITVNAGSAGAQVNFGNVARNNRAGMFIRGNNLGGTPGADTANVYFNNGSTLLTKNIIPFAWGNPNYGTLSTPESVENVLVTYGPNGVEPIFNYASDFVGSTVDTNVRLSSYSTISLSGFLHCNALVVAAPADLVSTVGSGMTVTGGAMVNVDSGVVLSANAGFAGNSSSINTLPGNVVNVALNFGNKEAIILTPSAIQLAGAIIGTGGLTKLGPRTATFAGISSYTGQTYLTGFNRFNGSVTAGNSGPFGADSSPIIIYGGNAVAEGLTGVPGGTGYGQLGAAGNFVSFGRSIELRGDTVLLRSFGNGTINWNGQINVSEPETTLHFLTSKALGHMVVNGSIIGPGRVVIGSADVGTEAVTYVDLMSAQSFQATSGFVLAGGTIGLGNNRALGSYMGTGTLAATEIYNTVKVSGTSFISALGGARNIPNPMIVYGNTLGIGGSNAVELSGSINARGGDYIANITNTATTTFSGQLSGGGFVKQGNGTLVLSGDNTFSGPVNVGSGAIAGGMIILRSNQALGSTLASTSVYNGSNAIGLDGASLPGGSFSIGEETLYLSGDGIGNLGALRNLSGNNTWAGRIQPAAQYNGAGTASPTILTQRGSIGVDVGTLTTESAIFVNDPGVLNNVGSLLFLANSIGVRKLGAGTLVIGSSLVNTQVGTTSFNWNAAIVASGSLDIQAGTVRIQPHAGVSSVYAGKSVVDVGNVSFATSGGVPTATLELTDNAMVIDYTGTSPLATLRSYLKAGYNNGAWNGTGIISSEAGASLLPVGVAGRKSIAYGEQSALQFATLYGNPLDSTSILMQLTYAGDANFDGQVDSVDLGALAMNWQGSGVWTGGDFNYDGVVDIGDFYILGVNWLIGTSSPQPGPTLDELAAAFGLPPVSVPEPAALSLLLVAAALSMRRRRKNMRKTRSEVPYINGLM